MVHKQGKNLWKFARTHYKLLGKENSSDKYCVKFQGFSRIFIKINKSQDFPEHFSNSRTFQDLWEPWVLLIKEIIDCIYNKVTRVLKNKWTVLTLFRMGFFMNAHGSGGDFWPPSLITVKHILQWWNLTVIPDLKKIQKLYKSRDTSFEFCWHQHFFTRNQQILLHQELQI